jgi:hypothetical protein
MPDQSYRIRLVTQGDEFEAEGDKEFVLEMLKRYDRERAISRRRSKSPYATPETSDDSSKPPELTKSVSPAEFIRQLNFKKHTDIVLAFGYYLERNMAVKEFTPADLNNLYYEAKIERSNTSNSCIRNIERGYMMEAKGTKKGAKKRYTLTQSGEKQIESALQIAPE